jgi:hypothetical protein
MLLSVFFALAVRYRICGLGKLFAAIHLLQYFMEGYRVILLLSILYHSTLLAHLNTI